MPVAVFIATGIKKGVEKMNSVKTVSRKEVVLPLVVSILGAFAIWGGLIAITPLVTGNAYINGMNEINANYANGDIIARLEYLLLDISNFTFLFTPIATLAMFVFALLGAYLERKGSKYMGTGVDGNGQIYTAQLIFSIIFTFAAEWLYGGIFSPLGFVPTLATYLFFQHFVMHYGAGVAKITTIGIYSTLLATPCCLLTRITVVDTLGMPMFIAVATGALLFFPMGHMVFRLMPWMTPRNRASEPAIIKPEKTKFVWFIDQLLGDVGQLGVSGSSISSIALITFCIISYCLNPESTGFAAGLLPITLLGILVTGALTIFLFYPYYDNMLVVSFGSMVTVAAFLVTYPVTPIMVVLAIIYSVIVPVPVTAWVFKVANFKGQFCLFPLVMIAIILAVVPFSLFIKLVLMPLGI